MFPFQSVPLSAIAQSLGNGFSIYNDHFIMLKLYSDERSIGT